LRFNGDPAAEGVSVRPLSAESGAAAVGPHLLIPLDAGLSGESGLSARLGRGFVSSTDFPTVVSGLHEKLVRMIFTEASMTAQGGAAAEAGRYHVETLHIGQELLPGQDIILDSRILTASMGGQNIRSRTEGEFISIWPGSNDIMYTDSEPGRTVDIRVKHRDRFL
jgi:hypothetical protein